MLDYMFFIKSVEINTLFKKTNVYKLVFGHNWCYRRNGQKGVKMVNEAYETNGAVDSPLDFTLNKMDVKTIFECIKHILKNYFNLIL